MYEAIWGDQIILLLLFIGAGSLEGLVKKKLNTFLQTGGGWVRSPNFLLFFLAIVF